jgi:phage tail-like protein
VAALGQRSPAPSTRPFALVRTRDQWWRASHDGTALAPGGVVELASTEGTRPEPVEGPAPLATGLAFDSACRAYHVAGGRIERVHWAAHEPFRAVAAGEAVGLVDRAPPAVLGDFAPSRGGAGGPLDAPLGLAVDAADRLFVCEAGRNRILVHDLGSRRLLRAIPLAAEGAAGPRPLDVAAAGELVHCVTAEPARLLLLGASGAPRELPLPPGVAAPARVAASPSGRIAVLDRSGLVAFLDGAPPIDLTVRLHPGQPDPRQATDLAFESDDVLVVAYLDGERLFRFLATGDAAADPDLRPLEARGYDGRGIARGPDGRTAFWTARGLRSSVPIRRRFALAGTVVTFRLDSGAYQTRWGRLFLDACLPDGTSAEVYCATADEQEESEPTLERALPSGLRLLPPRPELSPPMPPLALEPGRALDAEPFRPVHRRETGRELPWSPIAGDDPFATYEAPIHAAAGRYLWVWLRLRGNGLLSPKVRCLRAEHPGHDYLRRLPRIFSRDESVADFLQRFLALFEGFLGEVEARGVERAILLDPRATPDALLPWLASFMGLALDERWPPARRRALVAEVADLWRAKGTVCGLSRFIELYLGRRPILVEAFRLRGPGGAVLGTDPGGGASVVGAGFRVGGATGAAAAGAYDPRQVEDAFRTHAHRFTVIVPAPLDDEQLAVVRDILETQRPAHTLYDLCTMGAGMRLGQALHVGISSIVGRGGGFEPLLVGDSALGRGAILGRPAPGARAGLERLGDTTRIA